ncbi:tricarballylate dehydrogenase [Psychrobacter phenylpyruvicus]|uniref:Tricarballylate dehydrogenase n=2 Tax=Psychrobacter phenylpyruvicus TaxID=29432 RepID=A0A379LND8_9GAMM|nr:NAD(P)/FAD-dependent oxidoreductase [Psychrobacter phenylpyruvicus]SUD91387.1 tricarballylate dehydrogenase [Psychrobacter phenylpyruvicus]
MTQNAANHSDSSITSTKLYEQHSSTSSAIAQAQSSVDVLIIGAGASGLYCAMTAAQRGRSVLVIDHANKAGKKILMSGGGRCNFTNYVVEPENFIGENAHFCKSALTRYNPWEFIGLVEKHGVPYHERDYSQLFCDNSSKDILNLLLDECAEAGAKVQLKTDIVAIKPLANDSDQGFIVETSKGTIYCHSLVIATGGLSIPTMGATGFGYEVAQQFGHQIIATSAGLVPFTFTDKVGDMIASLAGISLDVIAFNERISFPRPMLFTHRGLSGPAMLQLSNYWQLGESIHINLVPNVDIGELLIEAKAYHPKQLIRSVLSEYFPKKLLLALQDLHWSDFKDKELANIKDEALITIGDKINNWTIKPSGTEGYRTAEVTRGGVNTDEVSSKTFESKLQPNLYFIGEVLDVTGWLGGYNFQWAWASGKACGEVV